MAERRSNGRAARAAPGRHLDQVQAGPPFEPVRPEGAAGRTARAAKSLRGE
jgi:hypothetical protein